MISMTPNKTKPKQAQSKASSQSGSSQSGGIQLPYFVTRWRWWSCFLCLLFCCAWYLYFFVRVKYTIPASFKWFSWTVFGFELLASSNMFVHMLFMMRIRDYKQVPDDEGTAPLIHDYRVRVLLPCYKESADMVQATVQALLGAALPPGCTRIVYMCDDGKDPVKQAWVLEQGRPDLVYIADRVRNLADINGKSANMNHALAKIFPPGTPISLDEVVAVFDADMVAQPNFFTRTLPWLQDGRQSIVLTPQFFHNFDPDADIFNHRSAVFWSVILSGWNAWGKACCTGTNYIIRAAHLAEAGNFPTYSMGEDTALALELQCRGRTGVYLRERLAVGEVPTGIRATCQQQSRWCKGGMQIYFNWQRCPLIRSELSLFEKILWVYGILGYFTNILTTPIMLLLPVVGVMFGVIPVVNSFWFALAFTAYILSLYAVMFLGAGSWETSAATWFTNNANNFLWFTFAKAVCNVLWGKLRSRPSTFKATPKSAAAVIAAVTPSVYRVTAPPPPPTVSQAATNASNGAKGALGDLWVPALTFAVLGGTIGIAVWRLIADGIKHSSWSFGLLLSLAWCFFNIIPSYLVLHYAVLGDIGLRFACRASKLVMLLAGTAVIGLLWWLQPKAHSYDKVLGDSLLFYEAHRSGVLPADNRVPWRGDSGLSDYLTGGAEGIPLLGGYYDAGTSFVKYSYPIATTTALLSWGLLSFPQGYEQSNQTAYAKAAIKWGADYLMTAHYERGSFVAQVGDPTIDGKHWGRPEQLNEARPVFVVNASRPGSDLLGSASAALSAAAMALKSDNMTYSSEAANHAVQLYRLATLQQGLYAKWVRRGVTNLAGPYASASYLDDLAWAAIWLHRLTHDATYLQEAAVYYKHHLDKEASRQTSSLVFDWQNVGPGAAMLLAQATHWRAPNFVVDGVRPTYAADVHTYLDNWQTPHSNRPVRYTPRRLAWVNTSAPLQTAANAAFLAQVYAQMRPGEDVDRHTCWAESQAQYMLGMRGGPSFVVGTGAGSPKQPRDRAASCPANYRTPCTATNALLPNRANPHILTGALVNGPDQGDVYQDRRTHVNSGVGLTNNAAWTGLLAALAQQPSDHWQRCTERPKYFWQAFNHDVF